MKDIAPLTSLEFEMALAEQNHLLRKQFAALEVKPWDRWPEGLAVVFFMFALTRIVPAITSDTLDAVLIIVGASAPLAAFAYRIHRIDKRSALLMRALRH